MRIIKTVKTLQKVLSEKMQDGLSVGFVPTMGALHEGHMSLLSKCNKENDISVVSIFVNPTQFNDKGDLDKYPRTLEVDAKILKENGCDYVFAPSAKQIYPKGDAVTVELDISKLTQHMEGPNRPGHFEGVVQVVHRLLDIVHPDKLYMGQKDFQQFTIINYMLKKLKMKTKLRVCPIIREEDGLAMSSRNVRLKPAIRKQAPIIYDTLCYIKSNINKYKVKTLEKKATERLTINNFKPEYFSLVDAKTLAPVKDVKDYKAIYACTAVWAGDVRLIDNMKM